MKRLRKQDALDLVPATLILIAGCAVLLGYPFPWWRPVLFFVSTFTLVRSIDHLIRFRRSRVRWKLKLMEMEERFRREMRDFEGRRDT